MNLDTISVATDKCKNNEKCHSSRSMKNCLQLQRLIAQLISDGVIRSGPHAIEFSRNRLSSMPIELELSGLKIVLSSHAYGSVHLVESLEFFAQSQQYFELGVFLLATIIAPDGKDRFIHLADQHSRIKTIRIIGSSYWPEGEKFDQSLFRLEYNPQNLKKHPWLDSNADAQSLPVFNRGNESDCCHSQKDWEDRDWLVLSGMPRANIRLAELLLKLGNPENDSLEVALEVEGGFRGVGPLSAEARFWLPGSFGWVSD